MVTYLVRRWLLLLPTLFLASILVFAIIQMAPGDPVRMKLGTEATPDQVAAERERLGLDRPVPVRYGVWIGDVARLNLGRGQQAVKIAVRWIARVRLVIVAAFSST